MSKLGKNYDASKVKWEEFDLMLLEGIDLIELTLEDKLFLEKFTALENLNLSNTNLRSLKNMPVLPTLSRLDLSDNNLNGEDLHQINACFKKMKALGLANNEIRKYEFVALLSKCTNLRTLDLSANPITDMNNYRSNIFEKLTQIASLDGFDQEGSECSYEDPDIYRYDDFQFCDNEF